MQTSCTIKSIDGTILPSILTISRVGFFLRLLSDRHLPPGQTEVHDDRRERRESHDVQYAYDADNRLITVTHPDGAITRFGYDRAGNRKSVSHPNGTGTAYAYDALNRLTDLVNTGGTDTGLSGYHYQLRADGRCHSVTKSTATASTTTNYAYDGEVS